MATQPIDRAKMKAALQASKRPDPRQQQKALQLDEWDRLNHISNKRWRRGSRRKALKSFRNY